MRFKIGDKVRFTTLHYYDEDDQEDFYYQDDYDLESTYTINEVNIDPTYFPYKVEGQRFYIPEDILTTINKIRRRINAK